MFGEGTRSKAAEGAVTGHMLGRDACVASSCQKQASRCAVRAPSRAAGPRLHLAVALACASIALTAGPTQGSAPTRVPAQSERWALEPEQPEEPTGAQWTRKKAGEPTCAEQALGSPGLCGPGAGTAVRPGRSCEPSVLSWEDIEFILLCIADLYKGRRPP